MSKQDLIQRAEKRIDELFKQFKENAVRQIETSDEKAVTEWIERIESEEAFAMIEISRWVLQKPIERTKE